MNKENIKLGMKVWYKDDEWEVIYNKTAICLRKFEKDKEIFCWLFEKDFKDIKEIDECQTSTTIPTYNFDEEELVEEWSKDSLPARILKKIFNLFK